MKKRQNFGQHFLKSNTIANHIVSEAKITKNDIVLEIGTGHGILLPHMCKKANKVISIEIDKNLYSLAKSKFCDEKNLTLEYGDGFKSNHNFTIFISNLPYSKSRKSIEWLLQRNFSRAVIMVQKEFADKLLSSKDHTAISILTNYGFQLKIIMDVKKSNFYPVPKVDSVVIFLTQKKMVSKTIISTVNRMFSYRRKTIQNVLKQFGINSTSKERLDDLSGDEIIKIAKKIIRN